MFLGDIGNRLDISDNETKIAKVRASLRRAQREKSKTDASQDAAIQGLEEHIEQLEMTVGMLSSLLVTKGVIEHAELERIADRLDPAD